MLDPEESREKSEVDIFECWRCGQREHPPCSTKLSLSQARLLDKYTCLSCCKSPLPLSTSETAVEPVLRYRWDPASEPSRAETDEESDALSEVSSGTVSGDVDLDQKTVWSSADKFELDARELLERTHPYIKIEMKNR